MKRKINYFILVILIIIFGMGSFMYLIYSSAKTSDFIKGLHNYVVFSQDETKYLYTISDPDKSPVILDSEGKIKNKNEFTPEAIDALDIFYSYDNLKNISNELTNLENSIKNNIDESILKEIPKDFKELVLDFSANYFFKGQRYSNFDIKDEHHKYLMDNFSYFPENFQKLLELVMMIDLEMLLEQYIVPLKKTLNEIQETGREVLKIEEIEEIISKMFITELITNNSLESLEFFKKLNQYLSDEEIDLYSKQFSDNSNVNDLQSFIDWSNEFYKNILSVNSEILNKFGAELKEVKMKYPSFYAKYINPQVVINENFNNENQNTEIFTMTLIIHNSDNTPMNDGAVIIESPENNYVINKITDDKGKVIFIFDDFGTYEIKVYGHKEIILYRETIEVSNKSNNINKFIKVNGVNLTIHVRSEDGIKISEADIAIYNADQFINEVKVTNSEGIVKFINLRETKYFYEAYYKSGQPFDWGSVELTEDKDMFIIF